MSKIDVTQADDKPERFAAVVQQNQAKPAFIVETLKGVVSHTLHLFDKEKGKIVKKVVEEPAGYLVKFSKGHSIRCRDKEHLARVGAGTTMIPLVDGDGEVVGVTLNAAA